jgi:integrase
MAHLTKTATGWRAQIDRKGVRSSRTFTAKAAAVAWAAQQEAAILDGNVSRWPRKTLRDALERYEMEVSVKKATSRTEGLRLRAFARTFPELAAKVISEVTPADIAAWRDARLAKIRPGSVVREGNSLRNVWTIARREWGWCGESPWASVKMPADSAPRERVASWREIRAILRRCGYVTHHPPVSVLQRVAWAFLLGLRTAMRAGEIVSLTRDSVSGSVVTVVHKMQYQTGRPRRIPLTHRGAALIGELVAFAKARDRDSLLDISNRSLDAMFRKVTSSLLIDDLHFHDSRATALTHLARRLDVMTLARISGHRDLKILFQSYYRESESSIAARLAKPTPARL